MQCGLWPWQLVGLARQGAKIDANEEGTRRLPMGVVDGEAIRFQPTTFDCEECGAKTDVMVLCEGSDQEAWKEDGWFIIPIKRMEITILQAGCEHMTDRYGDAKGMLLRTVED